MCDFDNQSMDVETPRNVYLSAIYKRSFAFHTVKNRMPVILTSLIDNLVRNKDEISEKYSSKGSDDLKRIIGELSKLKYEIQTNKPLICLKSSLPDAKYYNNYIEKQATNESPATHFNTIWLLTECYMYRRINEIFESTSLKSFDYFQNQKQQAYFTAIRLIEQMANYIVDILENDDPIAKKETFTKILKLNLWGNKCDLSISLGEMNDHSQLFDVHQLDPFVLSDQSDQIWEAVSSHASSDIIDIVFDNAGYEVFTDLCLADYLITKKLAIKMRLYVKSIPWFISDVTQNDFNWLLERLKREKNAKLNILGERWSKYCANGVWEIIVDDFWTMPFEFKAMTSVKPALYKKLAEAKAVFFKGDLNYRKLFGEINWDPVTLVEDALQGFHPSKLCVLRTIKADIVCGLKEGVAEECEKKDPKWMENGDYGLIQFCGKVVRID